MNVGMFSPSIVNLKINMKRAKTQVAVLSVISYLIDSSISNRSNKTEQCKVFD